jgi:hypothetical protein
VKPFPVDNAREKVLEPEEEETLFAALTGEKAKFKPIALLVLHTGLRLREATESSEFKRGLNSNLTFLVVYVIRNHVVFNMIELCNLVT